MRAAGAGLANAVLRWLWPCLLGIGLVSQAWAIDPDKALTQHVYEHWDAERGLPQNSVNAISQTPEGFLWLGTFEGVVRFDGHRMQMLSEEYAWRAGHAVSRMWVAPDGALWIGSLDCGLSRIHDHQVQHWGIDDGLPGNTVTAIAGNSQGEVWVGTSQGVARIRDGQLERVDTVPGRSVRDIAFDVQGRAWIALRIGGLLRLDGAEVTSLGFDDPALIANTLLPRADGGMWVGTSNGLFLAGDEDVRPAALDPGLPGRIINKLLRGRDGTLWIGFDGEGLARVRDGRVEAFGPQQGLANGFVQSLYQDEFDSVWIGTNGGVSRLRDGVVTQYGLPEGLPGEFARTVVEDVNGWIWAGLDDGGVVRIDPDGGTTRFGRAEGLAGDAVRALAAMPDGSVWVAAYGQALQRIAPDGGIQTWTIDDGLPNDLIRVLLPDGEGGVLIGSEGGGLARLRDGRFQTLPGTEGLDVRAVLVEGNGRMLIGTYSDGMLRIEAGQVAQRLDAGDGFPWPRVMSLYRDRRDHLWIGTQHGLARHDGQRMIELGGTAAAFSRAVFFITEDRDGNLWFTGNTGITQVPFDVLQDVDRLHDAGELSQLRHRRIDAVDGLRSQQINGTSQPAGLRADNGWLWFPTARGVAALDPARMMAAEPKPRVFIEDIVVQGELRSIPAGETGPLRFPAGTERIEVLLSGIHGLMPDSPLIQTRLLGLDEDWGAPSLRREAFYAALAPGDYRFEARAVSPRGTLGETVAVLEFSIRPTLLQRGWFWPILLVSMLALVTGGMLLRARRLAQHTLRLERRIAERTSELREKNEALELALHQLEHINRTDALTGVHNRRFLESMIVEQAHRAEARYARQATTPLRERRGLVLLMVDIDFFKEVNDRHGHAIGDEVLRAFAGMLLQSVRNEDLVVRWGGEEFVVLMRDASLEDGIALARRITANARQTAVQVDGLRIQRTCSVGLACHPFLPAAPGLGNWSETIDVADQAMYQAKARGRDGWVALLAPEDATDPQLARRLVRDPEGMLSRGEALIEAERHSPGP